MEPANCRVRGVFALGALLVALCACTSMGARLEGTSGPIAWRVENVRTVDQQAARMWSYVLVLRETGGSAVTFQSLDTRWQVAGQPAGTHQARTRIRLEARGEQRLSLSEGFSLTGGGIARLLERESLVVFKTLKGTTDQGRPVTVDLDFVLDANAPTAQATASDQQALQLITTADSLATQGKVLEAEAKLEEALALNPGNQVRSRAFLALAFTLLGRGQLGLAEAKAERAIAVAGDAEGRNAGATALGVVLAAQGRLDAAEENLRRGVEVQEQDLRAVALLALAQVRYVRLIGGAQRKLREGDHAGFDDLAAPASVSAEWIRQAFRKVLTEWWRRTDPEGRKALIETVVQAEGIAQHSDLRAAISVWLAGLERFEGETATARRRLESVIRSSAGVGPKLQARLLLGWDSWLEGRYEDAAREATTVLDALGKSGLSGALTAGALQLRMFALSMLAVESGRKLDAAAAALRASQAFRQAMDSVETLRSRIPEQQGRMAFMASAPVQGLLDSPIGLALASSVSPADGLELAERGRARSLVEEMAGMGGDNHGVPAATRDEEERLVRRVTELERATVVGVAGGRTADDELARARRALGEFVTSLRQNPDARVRAYAARRHPVTSRAEDIQGSLRQDEVLVEYKLLPGSAYVWVVRKGKEVRVRQFPSGDLPKRVMTLLDGIRQGPGGAIDAVLARELYDVLLKESLVDVVAGDSLVIVPDGVLHLLPFEVLVAGSRGSEPVSLGELFPIRYYPSAGAMVASRALGGRSEKWPLPLLAVADPELGSGESGYGSNARALREAEHRGYRFARLNAARREVGEIAKIVGSPGGSPHVLVGAQATKDRFLQRGVGEELWRYRFIHLATHGVLGIDVPGLNQPALLFATGSGGVDFLSMEEISRLRLSADLVVLSACQSGRGEEVPGEGVLGLTRGVLLTGAASVVVSLWNVADEATAVFMSRFYSHLVRDGLDKARALQRVKLEFLRAAVHTGTGAGSSEGSSPADATAGTIRPEYSNPFFWAPFVLVGEDVSRKD